MTDREMMLERLRSANPLPDDDLVDAEEFGLFVSYFAERKDSMAPTQTRTRTQSSGSPQRPWYRRPLIVVVGTAVVAAILAVTPLLVFRSSGTGEPADDPAVSDTTMPIEATTAPPEAATTVPPTTVPPTTVPSVPETGQRVGAELTDTFAGLLDMATTGTGLVAAGFNPGDDFRQDGVIVASDDGVTWTRLATDDPVLTTGTVLIYGITETVDGLVAVGMSCDDESFPCDSGPYPTVWTSTVGSTWTRTFVDSEGLGAIEDVIDTSYGTVAAGWINRPTEGSADLETVWTSPAVWLGSTESGFTRVWEGERVATTEFPPGVNRILSLAVDPDGFIVGAGSTENDDGEEVAAVWLSTDGQQWGAAEPGSSAFGSSTGRDVSMIDVAFGAGGFVAVGNMDGAEIAVWQSSDGRSWNRVDIAAQADATTGVLSAVTPVNSGWVAAGFGPGFGEGPVTIWTSHDATTWNRTFTLDNGYAQAISTIGNQAAVAGGMLEADDFHAAIWIAQTANP